ncbi:MAG: hypothetical protein K2X27_24600, partial [Candidatus Obscuribacterales bacterium]|nr:hypothetical protein [Candidatus Obscuribacterales bacterium]
MKTRDKSTRAQVKKDLVKALTQELEALSSDTPEEMLRKLGGAAAKASEPSWLNQANQDIAAAKSAEAAQNWGTAAGDREQAAGLLAEHQYGAGEYDVQASDIARQYHDAGYDYASAGDHTDSAGNYKQEASYDEVAGYVTGQM